MGLFGKIKNILFEDDDEVEMPVYTKEEERETVKVEEEVKPIPVVEEPIKTSDNSRFRNVKRDIDLNFDERDVLGEIPGAMNTVTSHRSEEKIENPVPVVEPEKKSPFLSFDEDEFERLNSRINKNENKIKKEVRNIGMPNNTARKANNNFSSTSTNRETRVENTDRYKINSGTLGSGKKPFTPSPVISPVYGILDKNYKKDDIVDKQGGMKREKVAKPIPKPVEVSVDEVEEIVIPKESIVEVDIDSVRKKAYGTLEDIEQEFHEVEIPELKDIKIENVEKKVEEAKPTIKVVKDISKPVVPSIEDQLEEKYEVSNMIEEDVNNTKELDEVVAQVIEPVSKEIVTKRKPQMLDELEKTSTLQILDDIEKELNSIKPITNTVSEVQEDNDNFLKDKDDTLENDLFNLIDSMYEEGEEDEND